MIPELITKSRSSPVVVRNVKQWAKSECLSRVVSAFGGSIAINAVNLKKVSLVRVDCRRVGAVFSSSAFKSCIRHDGASSRTGVIDGLIERLVLS